MYPKRKRKNTHAQTFSQRLVDLISEPAFVRFEQMLGEPNIFKIVGRTHYERWHSCFWGWLLDPSGSHLLREYALIRLLALLHDSRCLKAKGYSSSVLWRSLPTLTLSSVEVTPNENNSVELSVNNVGRFDIFLTAKYSDALGGSGRINLLVEMKIDSPPNRAQSKKYADWLISAHPDDLNLLLLFTPKLAETSMTTAWDNRWYCLDYQLLNDRLLLQLLDHPGLNDKVKPFVVQYVKNLKSRYRGLKMAITDEEKRMALALYERYGDVFDSIYDALVAEGVVGSSTSDIGQGSGREIGRIAVGVNGQTFSNATFRQLAEDVFHYLVDGNHLEKLPLPWGLTRQRYVVTNESPARHPSGRAFFYPVTYKGITLETHYSRERGIEVLAGLCEKLDLRFERIDV